MIGNSISNRITKTSKKQQQNNSETVTNEKDEEIPQERYRKDKKLLTIMEYQKIMYFLDNTSNQQSKFRTKNWVKINDNACEM